MEITVNKIDDVMLQSYGQWIQHWLDFIEMYKRIHWEQINIDNLINSYRELHWDIIW
jgi:hypothetical protein